MPPVQLVTHDLDELRIEKKEQAGRLLLTLLVRRDTEVVPGADEADGRGRLGQD
jgi:hypothetical protein